MRQGWGMPDVGKLYLQAARTFVVDESDLVAPLGTRRYTLKVPPGTPELAVTLVYVDLPGNPANQTQHRINDLSLKVVSPGNAGYWGNFGLLNDNWSTPGGTYDSKNTTENVFIEDPEAGEWTIEVHGHEIVADGHVETPEVDADFGLVVRGVSVPLRGDLNCNAEIDFADINPFVLALTDPNGYAAAHPDCYRDNADINGDEEINFGDINPFVDLLTTP